MVAHFPDTEGVTSSNLVSPTRKDCLSRIIKKFWVIGAAASALPSHGRGHRFDSYITHNMFVFAVFCRVFFYSFTNARAIFGVIGQKGLRTKFCTKWKESESHNESYLYRRSEETCYTNLQEI